MRISAWPAYKFRDRNPYTALLYSHMTDAEIDEFSPALLLKQKYSIWHIHWPESFLHYSSLSLAMAKSCMILGLMDLARRRGVKIVWTVHNLGSHEQLYPVFERWFWPQFTKRLDGFISLSESGMRAAQERHPHLKDISGTVIPHGHFREEYPVGPNDLRQELGLSPQARVLLSFGAIRSYKNLPELIQAFRNLQQPDVVLLVAGGCRDARLETSIRHEAKDVPNIHLAIRHIPRESVYRYFHACDLVVLPYREILNSGTAILALSFGKPVLVPQKGAMAELQNSVGGSWISTYAGVLGADTLSAAMDWARANDRSNAPPIDSLCWDRIAAATLAAYKALSNQHNSSSRRFLEEAYE